MINAKKVKKLEEQAKAEQERVEHFKVRANEMEKIASADAFVYSFIV
jgi:coenzyme F420-reducing hydrogenase delta subunit